MNLRKGLGIAVFIGIIATVGITGMRGPKKTTVHGVAWYASFDDALLEAKKTGKPILLLSMFGKLDEEMPCANARTLRATLFKDPEFKKLISTDVIPAWEMVRAVPKIEIDLGDGKKIKRTVRGNAVMYLCNSEGRVIDAYPGVYTAADFMPAIRESMGFANADTKSIMDFHRENGKMITRTEVTMGKAMVESPTLNLIGAKAISGKVSNSGGGSTERKVFLDAARQLTDMSLRPMTSEDVIARVTGKPSEGRDPAEIAQEIIRNDSKTNMTRVRPVIHLWFVSETELPTPAQAREAVLETILKIPYKDPYFGLKDVLLPGTPY